MNAETDSLEAALNDESLSDYTEEEIRLARLAFMSEYAH
jgi:ATP-dependent DNA helicase RecQ